MSREPSRIPRALWGRQVERLKQRWEPAAAPPPLEVTNPEILLAVKEELDYIFNLDPVKRSMEYANKITLILQKGEESKRNLLQHTPRISIDDIKKDDQGNIIGKTLTFQRDTKNCQFIFSNTPDGEIMSIGENNLDQGYNEAIQSWVRAGMGLFTNAIEQDYYTPTTNVEITYSDTSTPPTEQLVSEDVKGPMEI